MTHDPHRLSDDPAGPDLARALREARGDVLSPDAVARVRASLMAAGIAAGAPQALAARSSMAKLLGATRLRVGLVGLGVVGLGFAGAAGFASMRPAGPEPALQALASPPTPPTSEPAAQALASPPALPTPEPAAQPAATAEPPKHPMQPSSGAVPSPREGALLLEARRALGTNPARALTLVRAHEVEFPASQLGPERARIAAEARQRLEK